MRIRTNLILLAFVIVAALIGIADVSTIIYKGPSKGQLTVKLSNYGPAPNIQGIAAWINSQPLSLSQLRGKVVLVDFWTYSCINCIRSTPHLEAWYSAYGGNGLVIIGVHTPEFHFERNYSNVFGAVQRFGVRYPVALDNNYTTWDAYNNHYWPADYIIDKNGTLRYETSGEGNYNYTETAIRELLLEAGYKIQQNLTSVPLGVNFSELGTPEIYLGYATERAPIGNSQGFAPDNTVNYTTTPIRLNNTVYLSGSWYSAPDGMIAENNSKLFLAYKAKAVNIVASGNFSAIRMRLDGQSLPQSYFGSSDFLYNGSATAEVSKPMLYNVVDAPAYGWHTVEIDASPGFKIYTFTFG